MILVTPELLQKYKVKMKPIAGFSLIWNTEGTQSQAQVSLWLPNTASSSSNRVSIIFYIIYVYIIRINASSINY